MEQLGYECVEVVAAEGVDDVAALVGAVEEEEASLVGFVSGCACDVEWLHGGGVDAGVVHLGGEGHGCGCEVLDLFEAVAHLFEVEGELGHVFEAAAGVGADEVGDELVAEACVAAYFAEAAFGFAEEVEGGLAHEVEDVW